MFASAVLGNLGEQLELPYGDLDSDLDLDFDVSGTYGGSAEDGVGRSGDEAMPGRGRGRDPSSASSSERSEVHTPV